MRKIIVLVVLLIVLAAASVFVIIRSKNISVISPALATKRQMPELLVIKPNESRCTLQVIGGHQSDLQKWFQLPKCPEKTENIIFDSSRNRVLIFQDGKYWSVEKTLGAEPKFLAEGFKSPIQGEFYSKTWIDKKTKLLSVGYLIPFGDTKDNSEGDEWRKKFPLLKDTWISLHHADGAPPEGEPSVAVVAQLNKDGQWQNLAEEKTTCCADMAPGFEAVKESIEEDDGVYSLNDLLLKPTCQSQQCDLTKLKPSQETSNWISQTFKGGEEQTASYMPLGSNDGFLFHTAFGDSIHAMEPIYYCKNECNERILIDSPRSAPDFGQISFSPKSNFMIVSKEYEGQDAKVYEAGSPKAIFTFDANTRVIWLPDDFQF